MHELPHNIPDATVLLALTPEELGAKMLFLLRRRDSQASGPLSFGSNGMYILNNLQNEMWPSSNLNGQPVYPREKQSEIILAMSEAWAWLTAQGLIVPASGTNGFNGWHVLSRRARKMENESDFTNFVIGRLLPKEMLNPQIATQVWSAFMRGEFDVAAFQAMKGVEVAVRTAARLGNDLIGVKLMRAAFAPEAGPLTDMEAEGGERVGRMDFLQVQ